MANNGEKDQTQFRQPLVNDYPPPYTPYPVTSEPPIGASVPSGINQNIPTYQASQPSAPVIQPAPAVPPSAQQQPTSDPNVDKLIEILLILFLPPCAVMYHARDCNCHVCINILLLFPFGFPSIIHAFWYCFIRDSNRPSS